MTQHKPYFGGVPTDPDIKKLREAFPAERLEMGQVIPYEEVEEVIGTAKKSARFRTVTTRWRRLVERETGNTVIGTERGVGFKVLDNRQKLDLSNDILEQALRRSRRSYQVTGRINLEQLTQDERDRLLMVQKRSAAVVATAQIQRTSDLPTLEDK